MPYPNQILNKKEKAGQRRQFLVHLDLKDYFISSKRIRLFGAGVLLLITIIPYYQTLTFNFLLYDDLTHIFSNPWITDFSLQNLFKIWTHPFFKMYIPLTYTFWGLVRSLTHMPDPHFYHLLNVITHAVNGVLLFYFLHFSLLKIDQKNPFDPNKDYWKILFSAAIGSLLFLLHPTQVEAVAWISGFKDLASTSFVLLAFLYYFRNNLCTATLFYTASLLTKPSSMIAAPLVFCINRFFYKKSTKKSANGLLIWFILATFIFVYTQHLQIEDIRFSFPLWFRPIVFLHALSFYLEKLLFLTPSYPDYGLSIQKLWQTLGTDWNWRFSLLVFSIACFFHRKIPLLCMGLTLWCIALLPVSGLISFSFQNFSIVADRYLYFPMIFFSWMISNLIVKFLSFKNRVVLSLLFLNIIFLLGALSARQVSYWRDSSTLFEHSVQSGPKSSFNLTGLALSLKSQGQTQMALQYLTQAAELDPNQFQAESNLAELYSEIGDLQKSEEHYEKLFNQFPFVLNSKTIAPPILNQYGTLLLRRGKFTESEKILNLSKNLNPQEPATLNILGELYFSILRYDESLGVMQLASQLDPDNEKIKSNLNFLKKALQLNRLKN